MMKWEAPGAAVAEYGLTSSAEQEAVLAGQKKAPGKAQRTGRRPCRQELKKVKREKKIKKIEAKTGRSVDETSD